jgi:hypothetical protein
MSTAMTYLPKGHHVHVSWGLMPDNKSWKHTEPMKCGLCKAPEVHIDRDDAKRRVESCDACGAIHVITKGNGSWWYHDWQLPANMAPNWLRMINSDNYE